jgi:hypothetical protein
MSFSKLLAAGKSLVGMPDTDCRYRVRTENLLPKFISPKNPFAQPAPKPAAPPAPPAETSRPTAARMETAPLFESDRAKTDPVREVKVSIARPGRPVKVEIRRTEVNAPSEPSRVRDETPTPEVKGAPAPAGVENGVTALKAKTLPPTLAPTPAKPAETGRWFGWMKKLNPLALLFKGRGGIMASRGRIGKSPVQAELSLDRVQVVRNDLRDADLEIGPGRLIGIPSGASPVLSHAARPDHSGWSRLATNVFGVEHTQI